MRAVSILCLSILVLNFVYSCNPKVHSESEITQAMHKYDELIIRMDADSIAELYTDDGDLGGVAHGRDSIRKFLESFKNLKVLMQTSTIDSTFIKGLTAIQKGKYHQIVVISEKDTITVRGEYKANWKWSQGEGWQIRSMYTSPLK